MTVTKRRRGLAPSALLAVAALVGPAGGAVAQDASNMLGIWYNATSPGGIDVGAEQLSTFVNDTRWPHDAAFCGADRSYDFSVQDGDSLLAGLLAGDPRDDDDIPLSQAIQGRIPGGTHLVLRDQCCCKPEIPGTSYYIQVADAQLLAIHFGDGIYEVEELWRFEPLVAPDGLNQSQIFALQEALAERGHYQGEIDGLFGGQTMVAVRRYQEELNEMVTGMLTRTQYDRLLFP